MGKAIFVSYKYSDANVFAITGVVGTTTARHYVDEIAKLLDKEDHIFKGEDDGEDLSSLADPTIASKLGDKIFFSSVTIVLISPGMKETSRPEKDQWIPWEVSYSLREQSRNGSTSKANALLAVALPDRAGNYEYFMKDNAECNSVTYYIGNLFQILRNNMFNRKDKESHTRTCDGQKIYEGDHSYMESVKWVNFITNPGYYIQKADLIRQNVQEYDVKKVFE